MEYTVHKLAKLAGVSTRTLRYYDEIGILKPARVNSSGYRIYGSKEVDRLQHILFYRELGVGLDQVKQILNDPSFDPVEALKEHRNHLLDQKKRLENLIATVDKTIADKEGRITMSDRERFEGFKRQLFEENERKFGHEIRAKYGEEEVAKANAKFMNMTQEQYEDLTRLSEEMSKTLAEAVKTGDPAGELAQKAADLHRQWLSYFWTDYSKEAHAGLAQMYVDDERFRAYYDADQPGTAEFLRDAIHIYTGMKSLNAE